MYSGASCVIFNLTKEIEQFLWNFSSLPKLILSQDGKNIESGRCRRIWHAQLDDVFVTYIGSTTL